MPTTIPDNYTIQLQADFVTQVPIPNLVPDKPFVMPLLGEGGSVEFIENVTNEGLIEATNVQISAVSNGTFTLTPLVTSHPRAARPERVRHSGRADRQSGSHGREIICTSPDCCNLPELNIEYSYVAANPVEQVRQVKVYPVFVTASHYAAIESGWGGNSPSFSSLAPDLFNSPNQAFIQQVLTDSTNSETTDIQGEPHWQRSAHPGRATAGGPGERPDGHRQSDRNQRQQPAERHVQSHRALLRSRAWRRQAAVAAAAAAAVAA